MTTNNDVAKMFKALCDENRVEIVTLLKNGEKCACQLFDELNVTKSTVSHHMKILVDSNIVSSRKDGKWTYYSLNKNGIGLAIKILEELLTCKEENSNSSCCP